MSVLLDTSVVIDMLRGFAPALAYARGVDEPIARRAGEMGRTWRRSHQGIATADLIVAATAEELGLGLVTLNTKHFPMFRGLRPPYRA